MEEPNFIKLTKWDYIEMLFGRSVYRGDYDGSKYYSFICPSCGDVAISKAHGFARVLTCPNCEKDGMRKIVMVVE